MGLDFSHGIAHWSYRGFTHFRSKLVEALGYEISLETMYNDGSYTCLKNEPIWPLINHSDCDGILTIEEMKQIIPQLEDIIFHWENYDYDKTMGSLFINSMKDAIEDNEPLEFR